MSLKQTTELYASVLHQLLPEGVHDSAQTTLVADDIYAHAKVLAQSDIDAHRLLKVLEEVPLELLPDYEQEYGLPMLCAVPGSFSIEERLNALKLVRTRRNVFNRTYLEQILAVFGVTLIDVVKFKPMQCIAPCNAPVNTERLRYKVFLRLQYPVNADMGCIIENYLPGYLRIDWTIDMPWSDWILNADVTVNASGIAHYTAYKTNQREYYDSFANVDLTDAIIRSFDDADMQQWQGFKDAVNELTGVTDWVVDGNKNQLSYIKFEGLYCTNSGKTCGSTPYEACKAYGETRSGGWSRDVSSGYCISWNSYGETSSTTIWKASGENKTYSIPFYAVAQKIISNLQSSNQGTTLFAAAYLENVAKSIFAADESKQFVRMADLIDKFELNKTLRT